MCGAESGSVVLSISTAHSMTLLGGDHASPAQGPECPHGSWVSAFLWHCNRYIEVVLGSRRWVGLQICPEESDMHGRSNKGPYGAAMREVAVPAELRCGMLRG